MSLSEAESKLYIEELIRKKLKKKFPKRWSYDVSIYDAIFEESRKLPYKQMMTKLIHKDSRLMNSISKEHNINVSKVKKLFNSISIEIKMFKQQRQISKQNSVTLSPKNSIKIKKQKSIKHKRSKSIKKKIKKMFNPTHSNAKFLGKKWNKKSRIIIVGAGPAGINMASMLINNGYKNVSILEKDERYGGKTYTIVDDNGIPHEMGTCYMYVFI